MKDRVTAPVMMIAIGMVLILMASLILLIKSSRWDNMLFVGAVVIGVIVVISFFVTSMWFAKARKM